MGGVLLACSSAGAACGELRLREDADATPAPRPEPDATPRADAAPVVDGAVDAQGEGPSIDAGPDCAEVDIGSALGMGVFAGNTTGLPDDDLSPDCGDSEAAAGDIYVGWTAPATDRYLFDTCGSQFDTILSARQDNCGAEINCSDDSGADPDPCAFQSRFTLDLGEGERIILVVDGYGEEGEFVLNITQL